MKKRYFIFGIIILVCCMVRVNAETYQLGELLPVDEHANLTTNIFEYRDFYYNDNTMEAQYLGNNFVIFKAIKNVSKEEYPVSISIGVFDQNKVNIGTVNYCATADNTSVVAGTVLQSGEEKAYVIEINKRHLADKKSVSDIKYISILSDNKTCKTGATLENAGKTIAEIHNKSQDKAKISIFKEPVVFGLLGVAVVVIILLIVYLTRPRKLNAGFSRNGMIGSAKRPETTGVSPKEKIPSTPTTMNTETSTIPLSSAPVNAIPTTPAATNSQPVVSPPNTVKDRKSVV